MTSSPKFKAPVFNRQPGGKENIHDGGWLARVVNAVKSGTPAALKRLVVAYHSIPPHMQDVNEPISARPSVAPAETADVPNADDTTRPISGSPQIHPAFTRASRRIF